MTIGADTRGRSKGVGALVAYVTCNHGCGR